MKRGGAGLGNSFFWAALSLYRVLFLRERLLSSLLRIVGVGGLFGAAFFTLKQGAWRNARTEFAVVILGIGIVVLSSMFRQMEILRRSFAPYLDALPVRRGQWVAIEITVGALVILIPAIFFMVALVLAGYTQFQSAVGMLAVMPPLIPLLYFTQTKGAKSGLLWAFGVTILWVGVVIFGLPSLNQ